MPPKKPPHRKTIKHVHEPGDFHELTFSCFRRKPILDNEERYKLLSQAIDRATSSYSFQLTAFVFMPEHVHLLVFPTVAKPDIDDFLSATKRPTSVRIKKWIETSDPKLLRELTIQERPGKKAFRFWQEGPGYDRNLRTSQSVLASIDYLHLNPVRRKLVTRAVDWKWSSARYYLSDGQFQDPDLPRVHGVPADLLG